MNILKMNISKTLTEAENSILNLDFNSTERIWFTKLLDILKSGKFARIMLNKPYPGHKIDDYVDNYYWCDVQKIAHTSRFASFFDIYNHMNMVDMNVEPFVVDECKYVLY